VPKVIFDISASLDGFATAAGVRPEEPMGDGGQQLHEWAGGDDERGREVLEESLNSVGATIAGRRTYGLSLPWWAQTVPAGRRAPRPSLSRTASRRSFLKAASTPSWATRRKPSSSPKPRPATRTSTSSAPA